FGEDAAPGIEQGSRELVGPTKGMHGLPARLPALQELPPVLLLGGVASPVRHGWSPPGHGDPNTLCKTDFAGRSRTFDPTLNAVRPSSEPQVKVPLSLGEAMQPADRATTLTAIFAAPPGICLQRCLPGSRRGWRWSNRQIRFRGKSALDPTGTLSRY